MLSKRNILHRYALQELRKAGCTVDEIDANLVYVKYYIYPSFNSKMKFKLKYSYHRDNHGCFFLERIKPFNLPIGDFQDEEELVGYLLHDIEVYRNAVNSHKFNNFIKLGKEVDKLKNITEKLFLYKNVEVEDLNFVTLEMEEITKKITLLMDKRKDIDL